MFPFVILAWNKTKDQIHVLDKGTSFEGNLVKQVIQIHLIRLNILQTSNKNYFWFKNNLVSQEWENQQFMKTWINRNNKSFKTLNKPTENFKYN